MATLAQNLNNLTQSAKVSASGTTDSTLLTGDIKTPLTEDKAALEAMLQIARLR